VVYLAEIVAKEAKYRRIMGAAEAVVDEIRKRPDDMESAAYWAATTMTTAAESRERRDHSVKTIGAQVDEEILRSQENGDVGYQTKYDWLDSMTGGLVPGHVWVVNAAYKQRKCVTGDTLILTREGYRPIGEVCEGARKPYSGPMPNWPATPRRSR
jgi:replicative DNA helicase